MSGLATSLGHIATLYSEEVIETCVSCLTKIVSFNFSVIASTSESISTSGGSTESVVVRGGGKRQARTRNVRTGRKGGASRAGSGGTEGEYLGDMEGEGAEGEEGGQVQEEDLEIPMREFRAWVRGRGLGWLLVMTSVLTGGYY